MSIVHWYVSQMMKPSKKPVNQKSFTVSRRCEGMVRAETVSEKNLTAAFGCKEKMRKRSMRLHPIQVAAAIAEQHGHGR
jgi:hypothetical protein